jgi:hypothetical protein
VFNRRETCGYDRDVGIGTFGRGGAYRLIGTSSTRVCLAGCERFGAGTVFCEDMWSASEHDMISYSMRGGGEDVPGSGATSLGAALRGASKSTCTGSSTSNEGAMMRELVFVGESKDATCLRAEGNS